MLQTSPDDLRTLSLFVVALIAAILGTIGSVLGVWFRLVKPLDDKISSLKSAVADDINEFKKSILAAMASDHDLRRQADEHRNQREKDLRERMQVYEGTVRTVNQLEVQIGLYWSTIEQMARERLHRDDTPALDYFLDKGIRNLTDEECDLFVELLKQAIESPMYDEGEKILAGLLLAQVIAQRVVII